jgi:hypothetical protein
VDELLVLGQIAKEKLAAMLGVAVAQDDQMLVAYACCCAVTGAYSLAAGCPAHYFVVLQRLENRKLRHFRLLGDATGDCGLLGAGLH